MAESLDVSVELEELRRSLVHVQRQLVKAKAKEINLAHAAHEGALAAMLALGRVPAVPKPRADRRRPPGEVAVWDLGDWQGSKVTPSYNSEVMRQRVMLYCRKAAKITEVQRANHPVRGCHIVFGGDMVEGLFNFPSQPYEIDSTLFEQYVTVSRLLVDVVRFALSVYEWVHVTAEWGNHGRLGSKRAVVVKSDNVDRMCYELARQLLAGEERLLWPDCPEDLQRLEIGNYRALVLHGDEVGRNGFASPSTMVAYITRQQSGAYGWPFHDAYVHHYHTHQEFGLPNGRGSVFYNGSTESDNRYARDTMAASAVPSQRLHFVHPDDARVTATYKVWLA